jgi:glucokinase
LSRAVGIDIGGTKIAAGLVDRDGLIGSLEVIPTDAPEGGGRVLGRAIALVRAVVEAAPRISRPAVVGIAAGGWIDPADGRIVGATDLLPGWARVDLRGSFERDLGFPAAALNDVHAMGLAEARLGGGRAARVCLCVAVGTGIGGAIMIDGRLFAGAHGLAGAIGHVPWRRGGPKCSCGRRGCIEAEASGPAIARAFNACAGSGAIGLLHASLPDVLGAMESPDAHTRSCAVDVTARAGTQLGRVVGGLANTLDPDVIVLGGGVALALGDRFLDAFRTGVDEVAIASTRGRVIPSRLGPSVSVVGAGLHALDRIDGGHDR